MKQIPFLKKVLCAFATMSAGFILFGTVVHATDVIKKDSLSLTPETAIDIQYPKEVKGKLPMVIFAHNGGATKEDWGDYPSELAAQGYITASIGWKAWNGHTDFKEAINSILKKYSDRIDPNRIAFVGGCHGVIKMVEFLNDTGNTISFKALVFLSASEPTDLISKHAPILGIYSSEDHLGSYYVEISKQFVEEMISSPKKMIEYKGSPHGNELVTDKDSKEFIRKEIGSWLSTNLK